MTNAPETKGPKALPIVPLAVDYWFESGSGIEIRAFWAPDDDEKNRVRLIRCTAMVAATMKVDGGGKVVRKAPVHFELNWSREDSPIFIDDETYYDRVGHMARMQARGPASETAELLKRQLLAEHQLKQVAQANANVSPIIDVSGRGFRK